MATPEICPHVWGCRDPPAHPLRGAREWRLTGRFRLVPHHPVWLPLGAPPSNATMVATTARHK